MIIVEQPHGDAVTIRRMLTWPNTPTEQRYSGAARAHRNTGTHGRPNPFRPQARPSDTAELQRMLERISFEKRAARQYVNAVRSGTQDADAAVAGARTGCGVHTIGIAVAMAAEDEAQSLMTAVTCLSRDPDWMGMNPHLQMIKPDHIAAVFEAPAWDFAERDIPGWVLIGPAPYMEERMSEARTNQALFPENTDTGCLRDMLSAWGQNDHYWFPTRGHTG